MTPVNPLAQFTAESQGTLIEAWRVPPGEVTFKVYPSNIGLRLHCTISDNEGELGFGMNLSAEACMNLGRMLYQQGKLLNAEKTPHDTTRRTDRPATAARSGR